MMFVALLIGTVLGWWLANRVVDHRWYCGRRHRANHRCEPTRENLDRWRERDARLDRAEELKRESDRLRRRW